MIPLKLLPYPSVIQQATYDLLPPFSGLLSNVYLASRKYLQYFIDVIMIRDTSFD